jgi:O-antigen ligase
MWCFVFSIPWEKVVITESFGSIARILGAISLVLSCFSIAVSNTVRRPRCEHVFLLGFVLWTCMTYLWTADHDLTVEQSLTYAQLFLMVLLIWNVCQTSRSVQGLMQAYVLGSLLSAGITITRFLSGTETSYQRYAAHGFDPNDLALGLALSIPLSFWLSMRSCRYGFTWIYRTQLVIVPLSILLTASRGALISTAVAFAIVPLSVGSMSKRQRMTVLCSAALFSVTVCAFVPRSSWERLSTTSSEIRTGDLNSREMYWAAALDLWRGSPSLGIGSGAFGVASIPLIGQADKPAAVHNTMLSILVEDGAIGLTLFSVALILLLRSAWLCDLDRRRLLLILLLTWLAGTSALTFENRKQSWFLFSVVIGLSSPVAQRARIQSLTPQWSSAVPIDVEGGQLA